MHSIKKLIKVKRRYENQLLVKKNVIGCSVGLKQVDQMYKNMHCIVVYVDHKEDVDKKNFIPRRLEGIPTDLQEMRPYIKDLGIISVAPYQYHLASKEEICLEIQKIAAVEMKLHNKVDLAVSTFITLDEIREATNQSGLFIEELEEQLKQKPRFEPKPGVSIGRYSMPIESVYPGAATFMRTLIRIRKKYIKGHWYELLPSEVRGIGEIKGFSKPKLGMHILKSGRSTGVTKGIVVGIDASLFVDYPIGTLGRATPDFGEPIFSPSPLDGGRFPSDIIGFFSGYVPIFFPIEKKPNLCNDFHPSHKRALFIEQIVTTAKAMPGDSGAPLVSKDSKAIGILFAGLANLSFFNMMKNIDEAFEKDIIKVDP